MTTINKEKLFEQIKKEGNMDFFVIESFPCFIIRPSWISLYGNPKETEPTMFQLCGYVGIPKGHKIYKKHYDKINLDVHGGLTYSDFLFGNEQFWFIGFDCAHCYDLSYIHEGITINENGVYKDETYVLRELKSLVNQIKKKYKEKK